MTEKYDNDGNLIGILVTVNGKEYLQPPPVSPVPAIEAALEAREQIAKRVILGLKAKASALLVAGGMSESDAYAAGTEFVCDFTSQILAYERAGGNPIAGQRFIDAILAAPPAWWSPQMLALFEAELL